MNKTNLKLMLASVLVACAFGGIALGCALATASVGLTTVIVAGPTPMDEVDIDSRSAINNVKIKTKGVSDIYVVHNTLVRGGHTGWHSHPGPSIISVVSGQATEYHDDDPVGEVHLAGTSFVDEGGDHAHIVVNEGNVDLVLVAFQILPLGAPRRIDRAAP